MLARCRRVGAVNDPVLSSEDRTAILDLIAEYNWRTDTGDAVGVADLFTEDAIWDGEPGRFEGRQAIEDFNVKVHQSLIGSMHFNANHQFAVKDGAVHHRCSSAFHVPTDDGLKTFLMTYVDVIVRNEGRWRFKERVNKFWDSENTPPDLCL